MVRVQKPQSKRSAGKVQAVDKPAAADRKPVERERVAPLKFPPAEFGVAHGGKTLVVRDEKGQIVSVTHVSGDSPYGVGIKPGPGQTVKEIERAEDLHDALNSEKIPEGMPGKKSKRG
jgi:tryptophan synthase beta subunit